MDHVSQVCKLLTRQHHTILTRTISSYRRHADRTAQLWLEKLRDSNSSKRLNLVYLANGPYPYRPYTGSRHRTLTWFTEVAQQSKARRKDDFLIAFSPVCLFASRLLVNFILIALRSSLMRLRQHTKELPTIFSSNFAVS